MLVTHNNKIITKDKKALRVISTEELEGFLTKDTGASYIKSVIDHNTLHIALESLTGKELSTADISYKTINGHSILGEGNVSIELDRDTYIWESSEEEFLQAYKQNTIEYGTYVKPNNTVTALVHNNNDYSEFVKTHYYLEQGTHIIKYADNTDYVTFNVEVPGYYDVYFRPDGNPNWTLGEGKVWLNTSVNAIMAMASLSTTILLRGSIASLPNLSWSDSGVMNLYKVADNVYAYLGVELTPQDEFKIYSSDTGVWYGTADGRNMSVSSKGIYDIYFKNSTIEAVHSWFSPWYIDKVQRTFTAIINAGTGVLINPDGVWKLSFDAGGNLIKHLGTSNDTVVDLGYMNLNGTELATVVTPGLYKFNFNSGGGSYMCLLQVGTSYSLPAQTIVVYNMQVLDSEGLTKDTHRLETYYRTAITSNGSAWNDWEHNVYITKDDISSEYITYIHTGPGYSDAAHLINAFVHNRSNISTTRLESATPLYFKCNGYTSQEWSIISNYFNNSNATIGFTAVRNDIAQGNLTVIKAIDVPINTTITLDTITESMYKIYTYIPSSGGDTITGDVTVQGDLYTHGVYKTSDRTSGITFDLTDEPCIFSPNNKLSIALNSADYFTYTFPEQDGTVALQEDVTYYMHNIIIELSALTSSEVASVISLMVVTNSNTPFTKNTFTSTYSQKLLHCTGEYVNSVVYGVTIGTSYVLHYSKGSTFNGKVVSFTDNVY